MKTATKDQPKESEKKNEQKEEEEEAEDDGEESEEEEEGPGTLPLQGQVSFVSLDIWTTMDLCGCDCVQHHEL